jgi:excisionase family DNA binding protein
MADLVKPSRSTLPQGPNRAESRRRYITIPDAAEYLQVTTRTIRQMMADGRLTGYRAGSRLVRVDMNEIDDLVRRGRLPRHEKAARRRTGRPNHHSNTPILAAAADTGTTPKPGRVLRHEPADVRQVRMDQRASGRTGITQNVVRVLCRRRDLYDVHLPRRQRVVLHPRRITGGVGRQPNPSACPRKPKTLC